MNQPAEPLTPPLRQTWPTPSRPLALVVIGAGDIVECAHFAAYRAAGLTVAGPFEGLGLRGNDSSPVHNVGRVFTSLEAAAATPGVVFDVAVPADQVLGVVEALPVGATVLIQKPLGREQEQAGRDEAATAGRAPHGRDQDVRAESAQHRDRVH